MAYSVFAGAGQWRAAADDFRAQGSFGLDAAIGGWQPLHESLPSDVEVRYLAVRPDDPAVIFAGAQYGPCRSTDGGDSWRAYKLPKGVDGVYALACG
jgi:hypothetical protein